MYPQPFLEVDDYQPKVGLGELESAKVPIPRLGLDELETARVPNSSMASTSLYQLKYQDQGDLHELPPEDVFFSTTQSTDDSKRFSWQHMTWQAFTSLLQASRGIPVTLALVSLGPKSPSPN